jgi:hypothetical protein
VALGDTALDSLTSGVENTAVGSVAMTTNTSGSYNTALGVGTLYTNTTGSNNIALGTGAGYYNTTGSNNTSVGRQALLSNTTAAHNTAVGYQAGYANTTGYNNLFSGVFTGYSNTTGSSNTFVGAYVTGGGSAGSTVTTGSRNTILGAYNGNQGGLDIRTSNNNIVLSDGAGNPRFGYANWDGNGFPFFNVDTPTSGQHAMRLRNSAGSSAYGLAIQFNNTTQDSTAQYYINGGDAGSSSRFSVRSNGDVQNQNNSYGGNSDVKLKENIVDSASQWDDIKALTVRKYSLKADNLDAPNMLGVIAQEVETAGMSGLVSETPDLDADNNDLGTTTKSVNYSILYMKAVKALQEAMNRIETLETKVTALEAN